MRELQVPPPDRPRLGRVDRARRLCEADEEAGPHGRRTKAPDALEAGRRPRGGLREAGRVREFGLRRRPDDREQDPREDAGHGEGVPERSLRGEAEVRHDAAVLERAAGEAETVLTPQTGPHRTSLDNVNYCARSFRAWREGCCTMEGLARPGGIRSQRREPSK